MDVGWFAPERLVTNLSGAFEARKLAKEEGLSVVLTNGCFDLVHPGHIRFLHEASELGDLLFVGVNNDETIQRMKGDGRPIIGEFDRAYCVAALGCVDVAFIFDTYDFIPPIHTLVPDVYVKGGDYTIDSIVQEERKVLEELEVQIKILPLIKGASTTNLLESIGNGQTRWQTPWGKIQRIWG